MTDGRPSYATWFVPLGVLLGAAGVVFLGSFLIDVLWASDPAAAFGLLINPRPASSLATLANAGEIVAAVLAIAITVVAIVVELASNRYTHRITELFIAEPTNFIVTGFFVVTTLQCLWVTRVFDHESARPFVPALGTSLAMVMLAACLLILLPYFAFVFAFLNPIHIVGRIRDHTLSVVESPKFSVERKQQEAIRGIEQIADVALNSMEHKDKGVSIASIEALGTTVEAYERFRSRLPAEWFRVDGAVAGNSDFISMAPHVLADVSRRAVWFEMKVLRQYQTIYNEALNRVRDVNYVIAIRTRQIAERAMDTGHEELVDLTLKFFNTYLRATLNARDVRTAYNVLNQYRLLAEHAVKINNARRAVEIARYFKYYGLVAQAANLGFILETAAYDLCSLNECAFDRGSPAVRELLRIFLEVDKEGDGHEHEQSLRGVRKAQVKLATHYLVKGDREKAQLVFRDMEGERPERLASIRNELLQVRSADFWEVSDRGVNFDYLPAEQKEKMLEFFDWFGALIPPRESMLAITSDRPSTPGELQSDGSVVVGVLRRPRP
jgi:hypothetical protein